jgi:fatty acid desaturase
VSGAARGEDFRDDARRAAPRPELPAAQLSTEILERLTRRSAWRASLPIAADLAVIALAAAAALAFWFSLPLTILAVLVIGTRQHALFVIAHDAAHYLLYDNRKLNDAVGRACATLQGLSMCTYRVIHRLHHNNLYGELDPDTALHGGYPRGRAYLVKKLLKDLSGLTAWKTYAYFLGGAPALNTQSSVALRPLDDTSAKLRREARRDRNAVIAFHLLLLGVFAWTGHLVQYLVLWILPLLTVVQAILRLRAIAEHGATSDFSSPLTAARTNLAPAWLEWLIFPHQVNYHIEHHLYAAVPHYHLPRLHAEMRRAGRLESAEAIPFALTLKKIFAERQTPLSAA